MLRPLPKALLAIIAATQLSLALLVAAAPVAQATPTNILYLNSIGENGTGGAGPAHIQIAQALDGYENGSLFNVTYIAEHRANDLANLLTAQPLGFYDQIWFDTGGFEVGPFLTSSDFAALNAWVAFDQPEFLIDSTYADRNNAFGGTISQTQINPTLNEALLLRAQGRSIFLGAERSTGTAIINQILQNFGFDQLLDDAFRNYSIPDTIIDPSLTSPNAVGPESLFGQSSFLHTVDVPTGNHVLNANAGNRTITLNTLATSLGDPLISASFIPGGPSTIPSPATLILFGLGLIGLGVTVRSKKGEVRHLRP